MSTPIPRKFVQVRNRGVGINRMIYYKYVEILRAPTNNKTNDFKLIVGSCQIYPLHSLFTKSFSPPRKKTESQNGVLKGDKTLAGVPAPSH